MSMFSDAVINFFVNTKEAENSLSGLDKKFSQTVSSIQNGLIGKLGGITAGVLGIRSITNVYDETLKLVNLSERWNLPVEKVSQFANAFSLFGGDAEGAVSTIEKFQQMANSLSLRSSGPLKELSAIMGANLYRKDYMGVINALRSQYQKLSKSPDGRNAQVEVVNMLGGDITLQRMLKASNEEYAEILEKSQKFGVVSEKSAKAMRDMDIRLATINQAFKAIAGASIEKLVPVFDKLSGFMESVALASDEVKVGILGILGAATLLGPALSILKFAFAGLFSWGTLGLGALIAGAYMLYQNWDRVTEAFNQFLAESPRLVELCQAIASGFGLIGDAFQWLADTSDSWFPVLKDILGFIPFLTKPLEILSKGLSLGWDALGAAGGFVAGAVSEGSWEGAMQGAGYGMEHIPQAATMRAAQSYSSNSTIVNNRNQQNQSIIDRGIIQYITINGVRGAEEIIPQMRSINYNMTNGTR